MLGRLSIQISPSKLTSSIMAFKRPYDARRARKTQKTVWRGLNIRTIYSYNETTSRIRPSNLELTKKGYTGKVYLLRPSYLYLLRPLVLYLPRPRESSL